MENSLTSFKNLPHFEDFTRWLEESGPHLALMQANRGSRTTFSGMQSRAIEVTAIAAQSRYLLSVLFLIHVDVLSFFVIGEVWDVVFMYNRWCLCLPCVILIFNHCCVSNRNISPFWLTFGFQTYQIEIELLGLFFPFPIWNYASLLILLPSRRNRSLMVDTSFNA